MKHPVYKKGTTVYVCGGLYAGRNAIVVDDEVLDKQIMLRSESDPGCVFCALIGNLKPLSVMPQPAPPPVNTPRDQVLVYLREIDCVITGANERDMLTVHGRDVANKLIREQLHFWLQYRKYENAGMKPDASKIEMLTNYVLNALAMDRSDLLDELKPKSLLWNGMTPGEALEAF